MAFHPEFSVDPQPPYTPQAFPIIREMVQQRAAVLLEAAEANDEGKIFFSFTYLYQARFFDKLIHILPTYVFVNNFPNHLQIFP